MNYFTIVHVLFLLFIIILLSGHSSSTVSYDSSVTTQCLPEPWAPQYRGGIIANPDFNSGIEGWNVYGGGAVEERKSRTGNRFIVSHSRTHPLDSMSQRVQLEKEKHYSFSAWIQINSGSETVAAVFKTADHRYVRGGKVTAEYGCWSLLKCGIVANSSNSVEVLFESKNTSVEIWVDNVSLQPFTKKEWKSHQDERVQKVRKSKVRIHVISANNTDLEGLKLSITQIKPDFPFGCGLNYHILESQEYRNWFSSRFRYTTFTNAMKWYSTEEKQGIENYTIADAMVQFAKENDICIRGHNIFWDDPKYQPDWVPNLSPEELRVAADKRIHSVVTRYAGELIAWDVMNENLHFSFFEDKLGKNASAMYFSIAYKLDPSARMFMNEYNTIEYCEDEVSSPVNYKKRFEEILAYPGNEGMLAGIGVQGHFGSGQPNLAYMRCALDILATMGLPIWLTEVDVAKGPNQAEYLEEILREGYSHPAVEGIIMFAGPQAAGFNVTTLADNQFNNTPAGEVVDMLIEEWKSDALNVTTDSKGLFETSLFHGEYNVTLVRSPTNSSKTFTFKITKDVPVKTIQFRME